MGQKTLDLSKIIAELHARFNELAFYVIPADVADIDAAALQIDEDLARINEQITAFGRIIAHNNATLVIVSQLTDADLQDINGALTALSEQVKQDQAFDRVVEITVAVLNGAAALAERANAGSPPAPV
jgi:translation initiation factor 6 (eIF-6)